MTNRKNHLKNRMFFNDFGLPGLVWRRLGDLLGPLRSLLRHLKGLMGHLGSRLAPLVPSWTRRRRVFGLLELTESGFERFGSGI